MIVQHTCCTCSTCRSKSQASLFFRNRVSTTVVKIRYSLKSQPLTICAPRVRIHTCLEPVIYAHCALLTLCVERSNRDGIRCRVDSTTDRCVAAACVGLVSMWCPSSLASVSRSGGCLKSDVHVEYCCVYSRERWCRLLGWLSTPVVVSSLIAGCFTGQKCHGKIRRKATGRMTRPVLSRHFLKFPFPARHISRQREAYPSCPIAMGEVPVSFGHCFPAAGTYPSRPVPFSFQETGKVYVPSGRFPSRRGKSPNHCSFFSCSSRCKGTSVTASCCSSRDVL